jgi:hypothetical protein
MTTDEKHPNADEVPSGAGTDRAPGDEHSDNVSGGSPDAPTEEADGTPVENPSGG